MSSLFSECSTTNLVTTSNSQNLVLTSSETNIVSFSSDSNSSGTNLNSIEIKTTFLFYNGFVKSSVGDHRPVGWDRTRVPTRLSVASQKNSTRSFSPIENFNANFILLSSSCISW
jgi:hypothetical protein